MRLKIYFITLLLATASEFSMAQNLEWGGRFGGGGEDVVRAMHADSDGNVYTTGYFTDQADFNIGEDVYEIAAVDLYDIFIQKTDSEGNFLWAKAVGSEMFDYGTGVTTDTQGSVYIVGVFSGETDFDPGLGEMIVNTNGSEDIFLLKLNQIGEFQWVKTFGGEMFDEPSSVGIDHDGNVYVSGFYNGTVDFDPGLDEYLLTSQGGNDNFVVKIDPLGNFSWAKTYGNEGFEAALSMKVTAEGDQYITGFFEGTIDFDPGEGVYELTTSGEFSRGIFLLQLNANGEFVDALQVSGEGNMVSYDIELDQEGNIYLAGTFASTIDFDPGEGVLELTSGGFDNAFLMKLNSNLELNWAKDFNSVESITNYDIEVDTEGRVYATGYHETAADFNPDPEEEFVLNEGPANAVGAFVAILDSNGDFINALEFGGVNFLDFHGIGIDAESNIYVSAAFENTVDINPDEEELEELTSAGFRDNYIIKFSEADSGTGVGEVSSGKLEVNLYPNPTTETVNIEADEELIGSDYSIVDLMGKQILKATIQSKHTQLPLNNLDSGIYILQVDGGKSFQLIKQ